MKRHRLQPPSNEILDRGPRPAPLWTGPQAEALVARHLETLSWTIVAQNFRNRRGEIDIIADDAGVLVFLEVKARSSQNCGHPADALTALKKSRIKQCALYFLTTHQPIQAVRFDLVILLGPPGNYRLEHYRDAF